jgi:ATP-dependent exoDNAse (exonuclease V) beta subunit
VNPEQLTAAPVREPTPEQAAAIEVRGRDVLLEAGAGTGKTGVMVDRYCRLVCDVGLSPDSILAFTFTDKAAAELRQRIRVELTRRADRGSERAAAALASIGSAWVTTIHGFCNRVLAAHPVAAGVDPGFRVLDAPEAARAAREAFDDALVEFLKASETAQGGPAQGDPAREETVAAYDLEGLRAIVVSVHDELRSRGVANPKLPEPPQPDPEAALARLAEAANECLAELKEGDAKRELPERALSLLGAPGTAPSLDELLALATTSKAKTMSTYKEAVEAATAEVAAAGEGGVVYRHLAELLELFSGRFAKAKERRAGIDFEDLQILAARLLERAEAGEHYRSRFRQILVDEFQDTNRLQLRLIEALRGPRAELVVVGDELQSIYGFRHADLDVFRRRRMEVESRPDAELMQLSGNFRSRPEVIGAVNLFGETLLGPTYRPLRVGTPPPEGPPAGGEPAVELLLTARDGWDAEEIELEPAIDGATPINCLAEARFVAERLRELAEAGVPRGEMVVLLRAFTHLDAYEDSLERAGLRPYVVGGRGYWSQQQVADVCALLAVLANPLDDHALFGALASPACGVAPDTLWLLRKAAGKRRHVWPAVERAAGAGEAEVAEPERLEEILEPERELLREFVATIGSLRGRGPRLTLTALIEAVVTETGYDLAILSRPTGEARFANVRKMGRLAAEFESREGRDLRGFLDFLAARAESEAEAQAATAAEGHDGVRIMTVHNAKGLEFGVVAVPDLGRRLLNGNRSPLLAIGREEQPRLGLRLLRLGSPKIDLYDYGALCEESQDREAEEELRLFHVAATRAKEHLILSGVVNPNEGRETKGRPVVERLVEAFGVPRDAEAVVPVAPPAPRPGLEAEAPSSEIAVRPNLPSPERATELRTLRYEGAGGRALGEGPPPLVERQAPTAARHPLSYTAIAAYKESLGDLYVEPTPDPEPAAREQSLARGAAVHELLEWSQANEWREPPLELAERHAEAAGCVLDEDLAEPVRRWLGSPLRERIAAEATRVRAEVPLLLEIGGTLLRGSIDLLVEREGAPPLVLDYKTDRLEGASPAERAAHYEVQRSIYALAVAEALGAPEVEVAYVFLERPDEPALSVLGQAKMASARAELETTIAEIGRNAELS